MDTQKINQAVDTILSDRSDILSILEMEESIHIDIESLAPATDSINSEFLFEAPVSILPAESFEAPISPLARLRQAVVPKMKFTAYYLGISTIVFVILLGITNWSAYSTILSAYINPEGLKASGNDIVAMLDKSKITVYANATDDSIDTKEQESDIKKKLEETNTTIHEDRFSPKKLVPSTADVSVDFDIAPYDNRIIIPKIGKNIPLVDVGANSGFDFDHMENIFMKELEKGVVRYPGTARPGENGNAFIFGHSSNYPWVWGDYNHVFALLDELSFGDEIIVYYNQKKFVYIIREKKVVKPGNVKILDRDPDKKELSLMTCWPVGTTLNRLIVFAELQP